MVDTVKGIFIRQDRMNYGEDFGAYIENPSLGMIMPGGGRRMPLHNTYLAPAVIEKANEYISILQSPVFEVPVRAMYVFKDLPPIIISGRQDIIEGIVVRDIKTTADFDFDGYEESLQWRFYLDMLSVDRFIYDVFELKGKVEDPANKEIKVAEDCELHSFDFYSYPTMKSDLRGWIAECMAFIQLKGLLPYVLKEFKEDLKYTPVITDGRDDY